ncbi:MAG: outer membrane beta-barrel protein [Chitinophagaceae bacterium]
MKLRTIVMVMLIGLSTASAKDKWSFTAELGMSSSQYSFMNYGHTRHISPAIGARVNYRLNKRVSLISGMQYGMTKYHYSSYREMYNPADKDIERYMSDSKSSLTKLNIPLFVSYQLRHVPLKPSFEFGIRYNRFIRGSYENISIYDRTSTPEIDSKQEEYVNPFSKSNYMRMPVNTTQVHFGLQLQLNKQIGLNISRNVGSSYFVMTEDPGPLACVIYGTHYENNDFIVTLNYKFD